MKFHLRPAAVLFALATVCSICSARGAAIRDIQGASHVSPLINQAVSNVPGIVTLVTSDGFYMQDPAPDPNDATAEGIFVLTSAAPAAGVGDFVLVNGTVVEFRSGGSGSANLATTQITSPVVAINSTGNALPPAIVVGVGGRIPPAMVINDDSSGKVETTGIFDPAADGIDFYESLEGMRVQVNNALVVGPRTAQGEITVVGDEGSQASLRSARGGLIARANDFNPERIILTGNLPDAKVGDHFSGAITGVIDYTSGNFKMRVASSLPGLSTPALPKRSTTLAGNAARLTLATLDLNDLTVGDAQAKFDGFAGLIVSNLGSPSIICAEEVQDDSGTVNNGIVTSEATLNKLVAAITAAGGPVYAFRYVSPVNNQDGGAPGENNRQVFLFRPGIVTFVDRPGASSTTANSIMGGPELAFSPGRIDPAHSAFNNIRKPLAAEFLFRGKRFFVIGNHFNSKAGDDPLFGRFQPPVRTSDIQRMQCARVVNDFVESGILAADANAAVVAAGRFNDFEFSEVMNQMEAALINLMSSTELNDRYTFNLDGNSEVLHHVLVSPSLAAISRRMDFVHTSADYSSTDRLNDHDPLVASIVTRPTTFIEWQSLHFGTAELSDPNVSGFRADPDIDNKVNGLEAVLGTEPRSASFGNPGPVTAAIVGSDPNRRLALIFTMPVIALSDVIVEVQEATTTPAGASFTTIATKAGAASWTGPATVTVTAISGDRVRVQVQSLQTLSAGKTFLRLKAQH